MKRLFLALLLVSSNAVATTIVTTSMAITQMVQLLTQGTDVEVQQLSRGTGCPHHRYLRPSALQLLEKADIIVYSQQDAAYKGMDTAQGAKIKLEDIQGIILLPGNQHIWLKPTNARLILEAVAHSLKGRIPQQNLQHALAKIDQAETILRNISQSVTILHEDLAYLKDTFEESSRIVPLKQPISVKGLSEVEGTGGMFVVNNRALYEHFDGRAILVDPDLSLLQLLDDDRTRRQ